MTDPKDMTIVDFAKEVLKIQLFPYQERMLRVMERGDMRLVTIRWSGRATVERIMDEYTQWKKIEAMEEFKK